MWAGIQAEGRNRKPHIAASHAVWLLNPTGDASGIVDADGNNITRHAGGRIKIHRVPDFGS